MQCTLQRYSKLVEFFTVKQKVHMFICMMDIIISASEKKKIKRD